MSEWLEGLLTLLICIVLALSVPRKYDPAIRLKEWTERDK